MRKYKLKKRTGTGLLITTMIFCVLTSLLALSLARLTSGLLLGSETSALTLVAQKHAQKEVAKLRGASYEQVAAKGLTKVAETDFFRRIKVEETTQKGVPVKNITVELHYGSEAKPRSTLNLTKAKETVQQTAMSNDMPLGTILIWPYATLPDSAVYGGTWAWCQGQTISDAAPALKNMFNHYGGTNNSYVQLPDYRNKFLRGVGTSRMNSINANINISSGARAINTPQDFSTYPVEGRFFTYLPQYIAFITEPNPWESHYNYWAALPHQYHDPDSANVGFYPDGKVFTRGGIKRYWTNIKHRLTGFYLDPRENKTYRSEVTFDLTRFPGGRFAEEVRPINTAVNYIMKIK